MNDLESGAQEYEQFKLLSGSLEPPSEREKMMFDYILAPEISQEDEVPVETLFDDLLFSGLVFPLNKATHQKWISQRMEVRANIAVVNVSELGIVNGSTSVLLRVYHDMELFKFSPGRRYRLSPRLVDFNTSKVLNTLAEVDLDCLTSDDPPAFMSLVSNFDSQIYPEGVRGAHLRQEQLLHGKYRELRDLGVASAGALMLKSSQRKASRRILTSNLAVIWGPPGKWYLFQSRC